MIACEFAVRPSASCRPHPRRRRHALRARLHGPQIRCDAISCAARPQSCLSRVAASASGCSAPTRAAPASVPTRACRRPASRLSPQALRLSSACATCRCAPSWPPPPCFVVPAACLSGARICSWICHCSTALCEAASPEGSRGLAWSRQRGGASSTPQHPCPPPRASSIPLQGSGFGSCLSPPPSPRGRCLASGLGVGLQRRDGHCGTSHASEMVRMGQQHLTKVMTSSMLPNHRALVVQR